MPNSKSHCDSNGRKGTLKVKDYVKWDPKCEAISDRINICRGRHWGPCLVPYEEEHLAGQEDAELPWTSQPPETQGKQGLLLRPRMADLSITVSPVTVKVRSMLCGKHLSREPLGRPSHNDSDRAPLPLLGARDGPGYEWLSCPS